MVAKKISVVSMFSGCGGLDLGFTGGFTALGRKYARHPFDIVWANDLNEAACRTYRSNIGTHIKCESVWNVMNTLPESADVLIGGFPCQDLSINGNRKGITGKRSSLYKAMIEGIRLVKPKVFIAENVKGLLLKYNEESFKKLIDDFNSLGYKVSYHLYKAADYGVPQHRERVFIVGTQVGIADFMIPKPERSKAEWITTEEAIRDLECLAETPEINHIWSKANKSGEQGNRHLKSDKPAHTIRAECHGNIQFHYKLDRRISMREAARFQSFPDDFIFDSKLRETERQVGNAVPPVLAWHIANSVKNALRQTVTPKVLLSIAAE